MAVEGAQELLRSRVWPGVLLPAGAAAAMVGFAVLTGEYFFLGLGSGMALTLFFAVLLRRGGLLADDGGLLVRRRGRTVRSYRWEEIREAGLTPVGFGRVGLLVLPEGGPYDVPGPNSGVIIGQVWLWRGPDRATRNRITTLLQAHDIRPLTHPHPHPALSPPRAPGPPG